MTRPGPIRIAGQRLNDPLGTLREYAEDARLRRTLQEYDLPGPGDPTSITSEEAGRRTRRIASRVSNAQADWFARRSTEPEVVAAMEKVPVGAALADANPVVEGGLYDQADALYAAFSSDRPAYVGIGKLHKVLHIKRPALIPILDERLRRLYRTPARDWGRRLRHERQLAGHGYWAAIRADLVDDGNAAALPDCREQLQDDEGHGQLLAKLSDLRLLDILAWRLGPAR